jgi:hypothetical protein
MARLFGPAFFALLLAVMPHSDKFAKYHSIEAYEIRPGISDDAQVFAGRAGLRDWTANKALLAGNR